MRKILLSKRSYRKNAPVLLGERRVFMLYSVIAQTLAGSPVAPSILG